MKKTLLTLAMCLTLMAAACGNDGSPGDGNNNVPPEVTVTITDPAEHDRLSGNVVVYVTVDGEVDQLVLMLDGQAVETVPIAGTTAQINWNTTDAEDGIHALTVAAGAGGAMVATSGAVNVVTDNSGPDIQVTGLERPYVYTGTVDFAVELTDANPAGGVTLKVNNVEVDTSAEAPHVLSFDSTAHQDGPVEVTIEAEDTLGNSTTLVLDGAVINVGQIVSFVDGSGSGNFFIPVDYQPGDEVHQKYHWDMPADISSMMGIAQWENTDWQFRVDMGTGTCPHSGVSLASEYGDTGQIVVTHDAGGVYNQETFFIHIGEGPDMNLSQWKGESTRFWLTVAIY
jgi:hypothetical protein